MLRAMLCMCLSLAALAASAAEPASPQAKSEEQATTAGAAKAKAAPGGDVVLSGLSILGNDETPKELVIVPWKSSQLADAPGISRLLDDGTQPVDKDVFLRELSYFELRPADPDGD
jgi:hypothetical protein